MRVREVLGGAAALVAVLALSACGGSSSSSALKSGGTVSLLMGTAPDSLDPSFAYTTQAAEPDWLAYTGLLTYAHASGFGGTELIPGVATTLPEITQGGRTYTVTLRRGLVYSNGRAVKASDFAYTVERALRIPWRGSGEFIGTQIEGAAAYAAGRATTISGISADDATGQIVIHLLAPYGAFDNVLALPALGLVPAGTPFRNEPYGPPPGVGPYKIAHVMPNESFALVKNPYWSRDMIPGIPAGRVNVEVKVSSNVVTNAELVLNGSADVFDWADVIPGSILEQIRSHAADRYRRELLNSTYFFFLNTKVPPFSSQLAREAVVTGLDENAMNRLSASTLAQGCYFLPPGMIGHPSAPCQYGDPAAGGNLALARQLVRRSGMAGQPVTVWSEARLPQIEWMTYYTQLLNQIGFRATLKVIADAVYFEVLSDLRLHPQTGFADWNQDFPNPIDFYQLMTSAAIHPIGNLNVAEITDPHIDAQVAALGQVPTSQLGSVAAQWQALDQYAANHAYLAVFGYQTFPAFTSSRISQDYVFHPVYGWDWSSFKLK